MCQLFCPQGLNNGITIIAPKIDTAGHLRISIVDPQIVNGLQTSRAVFNFFARGTEEEEKRRIADEKRAILVRVIETADAEVQDLIIKATNSQNRMQAASLRMTDQIHRNIEALFKSYDLFYDRRKGYYRDQGRPIVRIISATALAQSVISIVLQRPDDARARPGDYFTDDTQYEAIFGEHTFPLPSYLTCIMMMRRVENFLDTQGLDRGEERNLKFYVGAALACEVTQSADPTATKLSEIGDTSSITDATIKNCYDRVRKLFDTLTKTMDADTVARGPDLLKRVKSRTKRRYAKKHP